VQKTTTLLLFLDNLFPKQRQIRDTSFGELAMAEAAFNTKETVFTNKLDLNYRRNY
jgi:hypothetical protein